MVPPLYLTRNLYLFTRFSIFAAMAVGLSGIMGAVFGTPLLRSFLPAHITIKVNTAICLLLLGPALRLLHNKDTDRRTETVARVLAVIVIAIAALSGAELLFGWNLGIDQLLVPESAAQAAGSVRPGLVSPITAIVLILLALALILLDWNCRKFWPAQALAVTAAVVATFGVLDFIYDPGVQHTHIAFPTAIVLLLLCFRRDL